MNGEICSLCWRLAVLLEMNQLLVFVLLSTTIFTVYSCPVSAIRGPSSDYCYVLSERYVNWYDAEEHCQSQGGHLASVTNAFLNAFLRDQPARASSTGWAGATCKQPPETGPGQMGICLHTQIGQQVCCSLLELNVPCASFC